MISTIASSENPCRETASSTARPRRPHRRTPDRRDPASAARAAAASGPSAPPARPSLLDLSRRVPTAEHPLDRQQREPVLAGCGLQLIQAEPSAASCSSSWIRASRSSPSSPSSSPAAAKSMPPSSPNRRRPLIGIRTPLASRAPRGHPRRLARARRKPTYLTPPQRAHALDPYARLQRARTRRARDRRGPRDRAADDFELIVVDDGSTDGTREILRGGDWDGRVRLLEHDVNQGKGAAIQTGATHAEGEFSAIFDADLEYDPADLGLLMPPLLDGRTNACFGVRAFDGYTSHSFLFVLGNKGVTLACNVLFNVYLHDIMTCQKMIRTEVFRSSAAALAGVRDRARDHRASGPARRADLRGSGALSRPLQRGGQEADRASTASA